MHLHLEANARRVRTGWVLSVTDCALSTVLFMHHSSSADGSIATHAGLERDSLSELCALCADKRHCEACCITRSTQTIQYWGTCFTFIVQYKMFHYQRSVGDSQKHFRFIWCQTPAEFSHEYISPLHNASQTWSKLQLNTSKNEKLQFLNDMTGKRHFSHYKNSHTC